MLHFNSSTSAPAEPAEPAEFLTVAETAMSLFGSSERRARRKVVRLCDNGTLGHARLGQRGDRHIPAREIARLLAAADGRITVEA